MSGALMDKVWGLFGMDPAEPEEYDDEENIYFVSNYINGSFSYELSTKQSRLSHISFKAIVSNEQVFFDIYLDADSFMTEHVTTDSWAIYVFDELDYDGKISEEILRKEINTYIT